MSESVMHETASTHVVTRVPTACAQEQVSVLIERLRGKTYDAADAVYVLDAAGRLEGVLAWARLLGARADERVGALMRRDPPSVGAAADQEQIVLAALRHRISEVPVVDSGGVLLGVVSALALLDIQHREHVEDLHRLAGIARESDAVRDAFESPPTRRARHRLPWLLVGFVGSMLAAWVMARFEPLLEANLAVAFFVPTIVYLADAIGTQTEAIVVRGLSMAHQPLHQMLLSELGTGLLIGATLGALALPSIGLLFGDFRLGASVAIAVVIAGSGATTIGLLLPWLLQRAGQDPAFGSGPLATVIQDVLSIAIYFAVAAVLVGPD